MNGLSGYVYLISLLLTGVSGIIIAVHSRRFKAEKPWALSFSWGILSTALLAVAEILSLISPTTGLASFWFNVRFLFSALLPVFWLKFAVSYGERKAWISRRLNAGLFAIPLITQVILWTNDLHGLWVTRDVAFNRKGLFWIADLSPRVTGVWFLIYSLYGMFLLVTGIVILLNAVWKRHDRSRVQIALMSAGTLVAVANAFLSTFGFYTWAEFNPFTPSFGLSLLLIAAAIFPFRFFSRAPSSGLPAFDVRTGRTLAVFLFVFTLLATGIIAIGLLLFRDFDQNRRKQEENKLESIASLQANELAEWRKARIIDAELLFQNPWFMTLARAFFMHPDDPKNRSEIRDWLGRYHFSRQYERIFIMGPSGQELLSVEASAVKKSFAMTLQSDSDSISETQITMLDIHRDGDGPIHISLSVPVNSLPSKGVPARHLGIIVMWIDPELVLYPYLRRWPGPQGSAETLLVRREENAVLYLNPLKFDSGAALKLRFPLNRTEIPSVQAVLGREGIVEGVDYRGVPTIAAIRAVPDSPWKLVVREDKAEVFGPIRERLAYTILLLAALILTTGLGLGMIWRRQRLSYFRGRAEIGQKLRDSLERFELANKVTFDVIWDWDLRTDAIWWNENYHLLFGFTAEEMEPGIESWIKHIHPEDTDRVVSGIHAVIDGGGQFWSDHYRFLCRDGRFLEIFDRGYVARDSSGKPVRMIGAMQDLTERIRAEKEVIHSRDLMRYIIEHSRSAVAVHDRNLKYLYVSQRYLEEYQVKEKDVIGKRHYDVFPDLPQKWRDVHQKALAGEISSAEDDPYERADGTVEWTRWECRPWYEADGSIGGIIVYTEVVTARKKAEDAIRSSLREKEVLLKEIHHRVKNNMQVISSLLNLQSAQFGEDRFRQAMKETQRRIRSMALLHEKLYMSRDLSRIDFVEYAQSLANHLLQSFGIDSRRIALTFKMDPVFFDLTTANPLGLILNEFLCNAMKHAFPGNREGEIFIGLRRTGDDLVLSVKDDGIGLPPTFDLNAKESFGIQIIDSLVQQLNGDLIVGKEERGASFELHFQELAYLPRLDPALKNSTAT